MRFFIVDDDAAIRSMLAEIIEDYDLGEVVGEGENGSMVDGAILSMRAVDILIIDLLMPVKDGIEAVADLKDSYTGGIIMLSQVEDKELIGNAYTKGVKYYITKPINRLELVSVIRNLTEHLRLQKVINFIERDLNILQGTKISTVPIPATPDSNIITSGQYLLTELGMVGESGSKDILDILEFLSKCEAEHSLSNNDFPSLKDIFINVAQKQLGAASQDDKEVSKRVKSLEQRVRRAIFQGMMHMASIGVTDYTNPRFEEYAVRFFDFQEVRRIMRELEENDKPSISNTRINLKRFLKVVYLEAKKRQ